MNTAEHQTLPLSDIPPDTPVVVVQLAGWVTKTAFMLAKGLTAGQIRGKIQRGTWKPGIHYSVKDGSTYINIEAYEAWVAEQNTPQASDQITVALASRFDGNTRAGHSPSSSRKSPHKLTWSKPQK